MQLTRLQLRHVRCFRQGIALTDLTPGVNLIHGPNESGKSTLVRALRAVFFERYGTSGVADLSPWGDSGAAPEIEVDFLWQGQRWQLAKRFLKQKRCDLTIDHDTLDGEAAEARLAALLGFEYANKGASAARHWGVPGLLWIEQGTTHQLREPAEHAGPHLHAALGHDLAALASSAGDAILEAVRTERGLLLTQAGKPRGELAKADEEWQRSEQQLHHLEATLAQFQADVDRLTELHERQAVERHDPPWQRLRQQQQQAACQLDEVGQWQAQLRADQQRRDSTYQQLQWLQHQQAELAHQQAERTRREAAVDSRRTTAQLALQAYQQRQAEQVAAAAQHRHARDQLSRLRQAHEQQRDRDTLVQWQQQADALQQRLAEARELQAAATATQAELATLTLDADALHALRTLARRREHLTLQQGLSATRLRYRLEPGTAVQLDDTALTGAGERQLLRPAHLTLPGGGTLEIMPGGTDLSELARQAETLATEWQAACRQWQIDDLAHAEALVERRRQLEATRQRQLAVLKPLAPDGVSALEAEALALQHRLQPLAARCQAHAANSLAAAGTTPAADGLAAQVRDAEFAETVAERQLREADQALHTAATHLAGAQASHQQAEAEWQAVLARPVADSAANQRLHHEAEAVQQALHALDQRLADLQARIAAARPEVLRQDVERLGRSAEQLEQQFQQRELQRVELQSRLQALSAQGLHEQRAECERDRDRWRERHAQLHRRAQALELLLATLQRHRQALTQRLQAPLQRHLQHYLSLWLPDAEVTLSLNDQLIPEGFSRRRHAVLEQGGLDALSLGAREQLGLISRLAYADLLREAGHPTLIVLDDALTHADHKRLEALKRILFDAGQRHQILLFTCHPQHWQDLGVLGRDLTQLPRLPA